MRVLVVVTGQQRRGEVEDNKSLDLEVTALLPSVHLDFGVWPPRLRAAAAGWVALSGCCSRALGRMRLGLSSSSLSLSP
jgi:hypothetical protein